MKTEQTIFKKLALAQNPSTPTAVLEVLSEDSSAWVQGVAIAEAERRTKRRGRENDDRQGKKIFTGKN